MVIMSYLEHHEWESCLGLGAEVGNSGKSIGWAERGTHLLLLFGPPITEDCFSV